MAENIHHKTMKRTKTESAFSVSRMKPMHFRVWNILHELNESLQDCAKGEKDSECTVATERYGSVPKPSEQPL